ncbi:FGGY-family carbohydrate kinase [Lachnospiraceae bacterium 54-53]
MGQYVMGLDNGGTATKAAVFDLQGNQLAAFSANTPAETPRSGYTERDMDLLWENNLLCMKMAAEKAAVHPADIIGVSVCGHGKGLYAWGRDDRPAYRGIISTDTRAWEYTEKWYKNGVFERVYERICQQLMPCQQAALLAWLKDHDRAAYDNIRWVFSVKDYIRFRLTGEAYCEATDISGSGLLNVRDGVFEKDLLECFGIGEVYEMLAPLKYSHELCGTLTREAAEKTGLPEGTPVAGGMFDIDACAIAMDITRPDRLCTIAGTWSINEFISEKPVLYGPVAMNSLFAIPGYYLIEECSATSAGNLEWCMENLFHFDGMEEGESRYDFLSRQAESVLPEECDVYFLPFLYSSNAHPLGKGSLIGLTTYHKNAHIIRAVYEGVAYSHKTHIDKLLQVRDAPEAVRMAGGVVNSPVWVQMFADILGFPIETIRAGELGALGCAMAATVAAGRFADYEEAARNMVHVDKKVMPDMEKHRIYMEKYKKYRLVRDALDTAWPLFTV